MHYFYRYCGVTVNFYHPHGITVKFSPFTAVTAEFPLSPLLRHSLPQTFNFVGPFGVSWLNMEQLSYSHLVKTTVKIFVEKLGNIVASAKMRLKGVNRGVETSWKMCHGMVQVSSGSAARGRTWFQ